MGLDVYSTSKAAWHVDRIADMRAGRQAVPVNIQLIPSDYCNQDCGYCAYRSSAGLSVAQFAGEDKKGRPTHNPMRMIPREKLIEILYDAKAIGVKSVTWTGGGEPTAHPDHLELFDYALSLGLKCALNTNGMLFRKGWEEILPRFSYVRFSFDGATDEEYSAIRNTPRGTFDKVLGNMRMMVDEVARQNSDCVVGAGYVVTPEYHASTADAVWALSQTGISYVRLAALQSTKGATVYGDQLGPARASVNLAKAQEYLPGFDVVDLFDPALGRRMDDPFCGFQQFVLYIGGNQKVYRCCYVAFTQPGEIGDLTDRRFIEWFYSRQKEEAIGDFDARSCPTCPLADKNATIKAMLDPPPRHVDFI